MFNLRKLLFVSILCSLVLLSGCTFVGSVDDSLMSFVQSDSFADAVASLDDSLIEFVQSDAFADAVESVDDFLTSAVNGLVKAGESLTFDSETGELFVNNELIIMVNPDTTYLRVQEMAASFGMQLVDELREDGVY